MTHTISHYKFWKNSFNLKLNFAFKFLKTTPEMKTIFSFLISATILGLIVANGLGNSKQKDLMLIVKPRMHSLMMSQSVVKSWFELKYNILEFYQELTAPIIKNRKDICVWKICSRPLKLSETERNKLTTPKVYSKQFKLGSIFI